MTPLPIAILGAGPVGLAAAAQAVSRGLEFTILEQGPHAGAAVADWGHVRVFSPWKYNTDPVARDLLLAAGWVPPHGVVELSHPEPGFYFVGMKSCGRAPTFLMATGYEQVRSVVAELAGDHGAARQVQLDLPETGVCSGDIGMPVAVTLQKAACCGQAA